MDKDARTTPPVDGPEREMLAAFLDYNRDTLLWKISGLSEEQARREGRAIKLAKLPMNQVARALETDETRGFMKAVVDADTDQILGAAILGLEGGELMAMLQIAMMGKVSATTLRDGVFAHPTLAEAFNNLFASLETN